MKIYSVNDDEFKKYGRKLQLDVSEIIAEAEKIKMPDSGSAYQASVEALEKLDIAEHIQKECFGGIETQIGFCWGYNDTLNALEWHTCSEVNIATKADLILLLGDIRDIDENKKYDSAKVQAFRLKKGEAVEVYATSLHYCPIQTVPEGFGCIVGLVKGTNLPLEFKPEDKLLFAANKWLLAHEDNTELINEGAFAGIYGENYTL